MRDACSPRVPTAFGDGRSPAAGSVSGPSRCEHAAASFAWRVKRGESTSSLATPSPLALSQQRV